MGARAALLLMTAAVLAFAAGVAGCGGKSDKEQARDAVSGFTKAFGKGDGAKACKLLTPEARKAFLKRVEVLTRTKECAPAFERVHDSVGPTVTDPFETAKVSDVQVKGNSATAKVTASKASTTVGLAKQDGKWLLTGVPGI